MSSNLYSKQAAERDWQNARRAADLAGMLNVFQAEGDNNLLDFRQVQDLLRLEEMESRGLRDIPLDAIRGSVGRYNDFTRDFLPKSDALQQRWQNVDALTYEKGFPPIEVYQVGESYFVIDGNHRVSVARSRGYKTIQARVFEFETPVKLSAEADLDEVLIQAEHLKFEEKTRLAEQRPGHNIAFTCACQYPDLELQIEAFRRALEEMDHRTYTTEEAAAAWYDMVYTTAIQMLRQSGGLERFPGRTEADLFVWAWKYKDELEEAGADLAMAADRLPAERKGGLPGRLWGAIRGAVGRKRKATG